MSFRNRQTIIPREKILKLHKRGNYLFVTLSKNNKGKMFSVHRLVAIMFIPNPLGKPEVNHKWGIKTDNRASELEWNTTSENIKHSYKMRLHIIPKKQIEQCRELGLSSSKKVLQYDLQGNFMKEWESTMEAERQLKIYNIRACCTGKLKTAGKYKWKYKDTQ